MNGNHFPNILWPVLLLVLLVGACVPLPQQQRTDRDLEEMKRRLADLEVRVASRQQERGIEERLETMARRQADLQAGIDALRVEFQGANGRQEESNQQLRGLQNELALVRDDLGLKVRAIEDQVVRLAERPAAVAAVPAAAETPETIYSRGLDLVQKAGDFSGGRDAFQEFLKRYPQHDLAVNAMYWIGEAWYGEKKYENAILQFQDVIQRHPDHPKAPAALLKQGLAFQALGDSKNARAILKKVVESYPKSDEAAKAKERLAQLGG
jgi:tol-pal system protein YbgF